MSQNNIVHVAVGVIYDQHGRILIAKRSVESHQGGLWEFPGGKLEKNETVQQALKRELYEELRINIIQMTPLIRIHHDYDDKSVLLDVWSVNDFSGTAIGHEDQEVRWINKEDLPSYDFPAANYSIIKSIQLPDEYLITGEFEHENDLLSRVQRCLSEGIKLIQFRAHHLEESIYFELAEKIYQLCVKEKSKLLLNVSVANYKKYGAKKFSHGLHLSSKEIYLLSEDLNLSNILISASTHNQEELQLAQKNNLDFIVLSPVKKTTSHPKTEPLGWGKFNTLVDGVNMPVYALGGMRREDIATAKINGGQGISAIREFWCS